MTNEEMLDRLHNEICEVVFEKRDGSLRTMICTLKSDFLPNVLVANTSETAKHEDYMPVYDLEERAWRAFKPSKVQSFSSSPE